MKLAKNHGLKTSRITETVVLKEISRLPRTGFLEIGLDECKSLAAREGLHAAPRRAWKSRFFTIQEFEDDSRIRLSIQRTRANAYIRKQNRDLRPITWDELQEVKREIGYIDAWAVEIFPPDEHLVNIAWMRHLWIVEPEEVPFAWRQTGGVR